MEIDNLPYSLYLLYRKESWLYGLKGTEKGREFLQTLAEIQVTKADNKKISNCKLTNKVKKERR
ncbi:hypothetical protein ACFO6R_12735 [Eubacterium multiforme]|uniref:Uncharacterized protein n=1 Tax=Eubacterium multiforme TaxID=83339 RepID=A0ABT9UW76_9FIRM|nr:hypothetical protein [Eubacterium multiforme]MDQ0150565.1 hypothetical protein [Eubacterium multiforme]